MNADRELVEAVTRGQAGAFERLVREHQGLCWHIVQRLVRHPEDARELCQEVFLRVHRSLHQYRHEAALKTWIGRVAYSVALRHLETRRGEPIADTVVDSGEAALDHVADDIDLESAWSDEQRHQRLRAAIDDLPEVPRAVLTLYHLDELSIPEIADITGLAAGTIKSHLFRARLRLRQMLETELEGAR